MHTRVELPFHLLANHFLSTLLLPTSHMHMLKRIVLFAGCFLILHCSANGQSSETLRISGLETLTNGTVRLEVRGAPGTQLTVEASADLRSWEALPGAQWADWGMPRDYVVTIYTLDAEGTASITDEKARGASARFYRLRKFP